MVREIAAANPSPVSPADAQRFDWLAQEFAQLKVAEELMRDGHPKEVYLVSLQRAELIRQAAEKEAEQTAEQEAKVLEAKAEAKEPEAAAPAKKAKV